MKEKRWIVRNEEMQHISIVRTLVRLGSALSMFLVGTVYSADTQNQQPAVCARALQLRTVCEAANQHAWELFRILRAVTVMQDVSTGSLIAFTASDPVRRDVNSSVLPLSTVIGGSATGVGESTVGTAAARIAQMEQRFIGKIGVVAVRSGDGKTISHRADERFPMCSTFKLLAAAAVLKKVDAGEDELDRFVPYGESQLMEYAPVTRPHVGEGGMKLGDLCAAAIEQSDNTAGNLILETIGGPAGFTQFARLLGDDFTHLDHTEPELNNAFPGDAHDTTTPAAMCRNLQRLLAGDFLTKQSRDRLEGWLRNNITGAGMIRAAVSGDWAVGDKTGRNSTGTTNDIAVVIPPNSPPLFVSIFTYLPKQTTDERAAAIKQVAQETIAELTRRTSTHKE